VIFTAGVACLLILAGRTRRPRPGAEAGWTTLTDTGEDDTEVL
jgi:hypothetical protein